MGDGRIKVAKDKADLVKSLRAGDDTNGPFQSYADALVFAASLGIQNQSRTPIQEYSKEIDPIRQDIFHGKGYEQVINLLSIAATNDPKVVSDNNQYEEIRIKIFEEFANAGLEILLHMLQGVDNFMDCILILLHEASKTKETTLDEFDLDKFLSID